MNLIFQLIILLILSFGLTFIIRKIALKKNIIDTPNERSSHSVPTPRGGGLAIVISWFIVLFIMYLNEIIETNLLFALLFGLFLAIISFLDDLIDIKPSIRLLFQAISAIGALSFLGGLNLFPSLDSKLIFYLINVLAVIGIIWFINLYNFLDGIDAYACLEAIMISVGIYLITGNNILLFFIASILGFLIWNWPKAKIFMGDIGSTQIGFILVILGIYFHNTNEFSIYNWLILTSIFWFDATFTLFRRWKNKEKLSQAHKKHAYQRLVQGGFSHLKVDLYAIVVNILLIGTVFVNHYFIKIEILMVLIVVLLLYFLMNRVDAIFPFKKD